MADPAGPVKHPVVIIIDMALKVLSLARFQAIFLDGKNGNAAFPSMLKKLNGTSSTAAITRPDLNIRPRMGVDVPMGSQVNMPTGPAGSHQAANRASKFNIWLLQKWQWSDQRSYQQLLTGWWHAAAVWLAVETTRQTWAGSSDHPSSLAFEGADGMWDPNYDYCSLFQFWTSTSNSSKGSHGVLDSSQLVQPEQGCDHELSFYARQHFF